MAIKSVSIRIEEEMLGKLRYISKYEGRSINSHVLAIIRRSIKDFEKEHNEVIGTISPDINVKPTRKM